MKIKIKKRHIILAAVNVLCLAGFLTLILIGSAQGKSQTYNYACRRWAGEDSEDYSQFSIFASDSAGFTTDSLGSIRSTVLDSLQTVSIVPEEGQKLCPDAYSAPVGKATVRSDINGRSEAEVTAVGGDFFTINNFRLIDGSFFSDEDLMQDGAVIDRDLAWAIYGGSEVSGMQIEINGTQFYISGVVEVPETDEEKKCAGELPRAYISYDGASDFASVSMPDDMDEEKPQQNFPQQRFNKITCYELIMPDPVEGYAMQALENFSKSYENKVSIICNNSRFGFWTRLSSVKKFSDIAVKDSDIIYPYWENASRIVEFRLTLLYPIASLFLIIPIITAVWLIIKGIKYIKKNKRKIIIKISGLFRKKKSSAPEENEETIPNPNQLTAENDIRKDLTT